MSGENLNPELARIIRRLEARIHALEAKVAPVGAESLNDLNDAYIDVIGRADGDVLTWVETNQDWESKPSVGGFPITYDDGTYTYEIVIDGAEMVLRVKKNSDPTNINAVIDFDSFPDLNIRTEYTDGTRGSINIRANKDASLLADLGDAGLAATVGDVLIQAGGDVIVSALPTSDPAVSGALWNDSGTVKISP